MSWSPDPVPSYARRPRRGARPVLAAGACGLVALVAGCGDDAAAPSAPHGTRPASTVPRPARGAVGAAPPTVDPAPRRAYLRAVRAGRRKLPLAREVVTVAGGRGWAAWIADDLVTVRAPGRPPRTLARALPPETDQLAIGGDRRGAPTVLLASSERRGPLWAMPADGSAAPAPVPFAADGRADSAPGIRRGVVSFTRTERVGGEVRHTVRTARLDGRRSVQVWAGARDTGVTRTVPTRGGVAFVTSDDAYEYGSSHALRLVRPDGARRTLERATAGEAAPSDFGALLTTVDGTRLTATRWTDDQRAHPWDITTYRTADGRRLSRRRPPDRLEGDWGVDVPDGRIYTDMRSAHDGQFAGTGSLVLRLR